MARCGGRERRLRDRGRVRRAAKSDRTGKRLPLYDYRYEAGSIFGTDPGTGAFCYVPSYTGAFGDARVKVGERFTQTVDILPFIKTAFKTAQKCGYLKGCSLENMYISGCNYGWELPGTFDCMATSYEFNMTYTLLSERN